MNLISNLFIMLTNTALKYKFLFGQGRAHALKWLAFFLVNKTSKNKMETLLKSSNVLFYILFFPL